MGQVLLCLWNQVASTELKMSCKFCEASRLVDREMSVPRFLRDSREGLMFFVQFLVSCTVIKLTPHCQNVILLLHADPMSRMTAIHRAKKLAYMRACESAFAKLLLVVLPNGKVAVEVDCTQSNKLDFATDEELQGVVKVSSPFLLYFYLNPRLTKGGGSPLKVFFLTHSKTLYFYTKLFLIVARASFAVILMQKQGVYHLPRGRVSLKVDK